MLDLDYKVIKILHRSSSKIGELASKLTLPHTTIGSSVKRLEEEGYVKYKRYKSVNLSQKGEQLANELIRHARLIELLLINELGLQREIAHQESEKFNLLFSCETINKICEKYGHPKKCPCGDDIEQSENCYCEEKV